MSAETPAAITPAAIMLELMARYRALSGAQINEAATRLQFVNEILEHVLGWPRTTFNPEEYAAGMAETDERGAREWLDYHLRHRETLKLVVEAKRIGATFSLDAAKKRRIVPLNQLSKNHGKILKTAIRQARGYCIRVGTHGFVVTNGIQWIASLAFAHHVSEEKISAVVFYDLEDIHSNLQEFIDLLSPEGVASQALLVRATGGGTLAPRFARRLNDVLKAAPAPLDKNYLAQPMRVLMNTCFGDLTDTEHFEMLEECYVTGETTDDYVSRLEPFAGSVLPDEMASVAKIDRRASATEEFVQGMSTDGTPFLLVGRAGSGKSTFLAITKRRIDSKFSSSTHVFLHLDLFTRTQTHAQQFDHERLIEEICQELLEQAEARYPELNPFEHELLSDIFSGEIRRLHSSLSQAARTSTEGETRKEQLIQDHLKNRLSHARAYFGYLGRKNVPVTIFLDNVDRGTAEYERVTVQLAQSLTKKTRATVVTSLRDTTYYNGKTGGFLDVGRHSVLAITAPSFVEVARRRFQYARGRLRSDPALGVRFARALARTPIDRVLDFADIVAELVLGERADVRECIQALTGTNIRRALEFLEDFATSPNTDLNKLFAQYRQGERQQRNEFGPQLDVFLRSVMRMGSLRYSENASKILNLFQTPRAALSSHFIRIRILQLLCWRGAQAEGAADMIVGDVTEHLGAIGHGASGVLDALNHLGKYGLVTSLSQPEPPWSASQSVRVGAAGRYYLEELIFSREYVTNVADDTIIYDEQAFETLQHVLTDRGRDWPSRHEEKTRVFLGYLARRERDELTLIGAPHLRPAWVAPVADGIGHRHFGPAFSGKGRRQTPSPRTYGPR